MTDRQQTDATL